MNQVLFSSSLISLPVIQRGKVRDIYGIDEQHLLIVTTDRLSAFDVVLPNPIPGKGEVLNALSNFWFARLRHIAPNHLSTLQPESLVHTEEERAQLRGRAVVARRLKALPIEAIVRGYLAGSGWKTYQKGGTVNGIALPQGLREAEKLPEPIFTPSTKAKAGAHDENIGFDQAAQLLGLPLAEQVREISLALYRESAAYAEQRGIMIADTKFEFGLDEENNLMLIDEVLTPDSSRFWPAEDYTPGTNPPSFDKQYVRDYLEGIGWNKHAPGPALPPKVVTRTAEKYQQALRQLTG